MTVMFAICLLLLLWEVGGVNVQYKEIIFHFTNLSHSTTATAENGCLWTFHRRLLEIRA